MNEDFLDLLRSLRQEGARFLVVGAFNKRAAGRPRDLADLAVLDPQEK